MTELRKCLKPIGSERLEAWRDPNMAFSGGVKLGDLDDFISLSQEMASNCLLLLRQECVKPLIQAAEGSKTQLQSVSEARALPVAEAGAHGVSDGGVARCRRCRSRTSSSRSRVAATPRPA